MIDNDADDGKWVARCIAHFVALDPKLDPDLVRPIAQDMCDRERWRRMAPEAAAQAVFDFGGPSAPGAV